jgi:hypothetical protein
MSFVPAGMDLGVKLLREGKYFFSVNNQRYGRWGKVRGEKVLCCQFKAKIK